MKPESINEPVAFGVPYPAHTPKPAASPGMSVHSYLVLSGYSGTDAYRRYIEAQNDDERREALADMPHAVVTFYELPEGEPFFDDDPEQWAWMREGRPIYSPDA